MHFRDKTEVIILWINNGEVVKIQASRRCPIFHGASELHAVKNERVECSCSHPSPKHPLLLMVRDRIKGKLALGLSKTMLYFVTKR